MAWKEGVVTTDAERRTLVQGDGPYWLSDGHPAKVNTRRPGTITWSEHLEAWEHYARRFGRDQSAERLAERGGFGWAELVELLGHEPRTWEPRS